MPAIQSSNRKGRKGQLPQRRQVSARARKIPKPRARRGLARAFMETDLTTGCGRPGRRLSRDAQGAEQCDQRRVIDRLDQVAVEAGFLGFAAVLLLAPAREGDEDDILAPGLVADASADLVAVERGQADVEEDDLGAVLHRGLEGGGAVVGDEGL